MSSTSEAPVTGVGHNGGPRMPQPRKLTAAQARALGWIRDYGNSAHGLRGNSEYGGANSTLNWMLRNNLYFWDKKEEKQRLTARGERVLAAGRMVE